MQNGNLENDRCPNGSQGGGSAYGPEFFSGPIYNYSFQ